MRLRESGQWAVGGGAATDPSATKACRLRMTNSFFDGGGEEWGMWNMWRKKDRMAGGRLPGCKERGEWAELYFMMKAAGQGMKVSRPFGQAGRYDVGVENPREGNQ